MNAYGVEQIAKGFANHHRVEILMLLGRASKLSVDQIAETQNIDYKTVAVHLDRLVKSGLIIKRYKGRRVEHIITKRGKDVLTFLRMLE